MFGYWFEVAVSAIHPSLAVIGHSFASIIFWLLTVAIIASLIWRKQGWLEMKNHALRTVVQVIPIAILGWMPFYFYQIGLSIYTQHKKAESKIAELEMEKDATERKANDAEMRKTLIRDGLAKLISRGVVIRNRAGQNEERTPGGQLQSDLQKWRKEVDSFLRSNFDAADAETFASYDVPNYPLWYAIMNQIGNLEELAKQTRQ